MEIRARRIVACSLGAGDLRERRARWQALRARAGGTQERTADGGRLTLEDRPGVAPELEALVTLERECCAFADWSVRRQDGQLVLDVRGESDEAIAAVQAMLSGL